MSHTLSFTILDDLQNYYESMPLHITLPDLSRKSILNALNQIKEKYSDIHELNYFFSDFSLYQICNYLLKDNYFVCNRYEKYYVVAFAIDFTRFEVFSKDCDKKLIEWNDDDDSPQNGEIKGLIEDPDYNMNPIIKLLSTINETKI